MFVFALLIRFIAAAFGGALRHMRQTKPKPLCSECAFSHIQFGGSGRSTISCTFGGGVRPMELDVLYCTDYRPRMAPIRPPIGFVQEITPAE